jgi:hypothetical protein|tara:strand:+ start:198 stop:341 length:144 start_codon:yes stop_codon:yes gene_type:complete
MDPTTAAMVAIAVAAASEVIAISPLKENSVIQMVVEVLKKFFPKKVG